MLYDDEEKRYFHSQSWRDNDEKLCNSFSSCWDYTRCQQTFSCVSSNSVCLFILGIHFTSLKIEIQREGAVMITTWMKTVENFNARTISLIWILLKFEIVKEIFFIILMTTWKCVRTLNNQKLQRWNFPLIMSEQIWGINFFSKIFQALPTFHSILNPQKLLVALNHKTCLPESTNKNSTLPSIFIFVQLNIFLAETWKCKMQSSFSFIFFHECRFSFSSIHHGKLCGTTRVNG